MVRAEDGTPLYRDDDHLTRTASESLAPIFADVFSGMAADGGVTLPQ